jgi:hypothetical protein
MMTLNSRTTNMPMRAESIPATATNELLKPVE